MTPKDLEEALEMGMDWSLREGYAWAEVCPSRVPLLQFIFLRVS